MTAAFIIGGLVVAVILLVIGLVIASAIGRVIERRDTQIPRKDDET